MVQHSRRRDRRRPTLCRIQRRSGMAESFTLGQRFTGAMVFGDVHKERIQLNEETVWSGSMQDCDNPEAAKHVDEIKQPLFDGKYKEATELTNRTQICTGQGTGHGNGSKAPFGCYQTMGDLWIDFDNKSPYTDYRRELNLMMRQPGSLTSKGMSVSNEKSLSAIRPGNGHAPIGR